jgi:UDP-N-acetylenolpyruvoylglucosamine reductase
MFAEREQLPVSVIGGGNNLLVKDRGVRGVVLRLEGCLGRAEFHGEEAIAGAGVSLSALIREAAALNLGGIEALVGIPPRSAAPGDERRDGRRLDRRFRQRRVLPASDGFAR